MFIGIILPISRVKIQYNDGPWDLQDVRPVPSSYSVIIKVITAVREQYVYIMT